MSSVEPERVGVRAFCDYDHMDNFRPKPAHHSASNLKKNGVRHTRQRTAAHPESAAGALAGGPDFRSGVRWLKYHM